MLLPELIDHIEKKAYFNLRMHLDNHGSELNDCVFELFERLLYAAEKDGFNEELYLSIEKTSLLMSSKERIVCIMSMFRDFKDPILLNRLTNLVCLNIDSTTLK